MTVKFLKLHSNGDPFLISSIDIYKVYKKIKGKGSIITDSDSEIVECDETLDIIELLLNEFEIDVIEFSNN